MKFFFIFVILCKLSLSLGLTKLNINVLNEERDATSEEPNFCPELAPQCSCLTSEQIVKCEAFNSFSELDFSLLGGTEDQPKKLIELELAPAQKITLDNTLNLQNIQVSQTIVLRNIDGIDLLANPFKDIVVGDNLYLYLISSNIRTVQSSCSIEILDETYTSLFSLFNYIGFDDNTYTDDLCPLIFHNTKISVLDLYDLSATNYLRFSELIDEDFELNSNVENLKISYSDGVVVNNEILNKRVFENLRTFDLAELKLGGIDTGAFVYTQKLKHIYLTLDNMEEFIQSSNNSWMVHLNINVDVDFSNNDSIIENRANALVIDLNTRNADKQYTFPSSDAQFFTYFPYDRMVFFRIYSAEALDCSDTLEWLLQNAEYYDPIEYLNTSSVYKCLLGERFNYCPELGPYCSCLTSPLIIKCDNFTDFAQLDFSTLEGTENGPKKIFELELAPTQKVTLGNRLKLSNIEVTERIVLRNIDGFELLSNPFKDIVADDDLLYLYLYSSNIRTIETSCNTSILGDDYKSLFSLFTYILFADDLTYSDQFCPLIFHNSRISLIDAYYQTRNNYLRFSELLDQNFDLNSNIEYLKISYSNDIVVNNQLLNKRVFANLQTFDLENIRLAGIEIGAFVYTQKLKRILLTLENMEQFIKSSNNEWMVHLNVNVDIDYNNNDSIIENRANSLLIQFNSRNTGQSYTFPDEDAQYLTYFPYNRFVFVRILAALNLECSNTLKWLLQNANYYEPVSFLNTTSVYNCFVTPERPNYCPELAPYCSCFASPTVMKCENFASFSDLYFNRLPLVEDKPRKIAELELIPLAFASLTLDSSLSLANIELTDKVILRNLNGFDLLANPFQAVTPVKELSLYIYDSNILTAQASCSISILDASYTSLFSLFSYILFGEGLKYEENFCPLIFHNTKLDLVELYGMGPANGDYLVFSDLIEQDFDLNSNIDHLKISFSNEIVVNNKLLNKRVFENLGIFDLDNIRLGGIDIGAFVHTQKLKRIFLTLENMQEFIKKSNNSWMVHLNVNVDVDYTRNDSIIENQANALVIQMNSRNTGQEYTFPNSDAQYFTYFPYDRMVFFRILAERNLECSDTLKWLLQNANYYDPISFLNTSSVYNCFLLPEITTTTTTTTSTTSTTTTTIATTPTTKKPDSTVSLGLFLGLVIPFGVISVVSLAAVGYLLYAYVFYPKQPKVIPSEGMEMF